MPKSAGVLKKKSEVLFSVIKYQVYEIYWTAREKNYTSVRNSPPGRGPRCNVIVANLQQVNDILFVLKSELRLSS